MVIRSWLFLDKEYCLRSRAAIKDGQEQSTIVHNFISPSDETSFGLCSIKYILA